MKFSIFFSVVASLLLAGQCAANSLEELAAALPKCGVSKALPLIHVVPWLTLL